MSVAAAPDAAVPDDDRTLLMERRLPASPERVFAAWTDAAQLAEWFGPPGMRVVHCRVDPRDGGAWELALREASGRNLAVSGRYLAVEPPRRLSFTWAWHEDGTLASPREHETVVTLAFDAAGDGTMMHLVQARFRDAAGATRHREGWSPVFDRLVQCLEAASDRRRSA